jgi:hypothetical protein
MEENSAVSLSQAFTTHYPNVFTPILSLSEGRAGIAWVPSNKMLFSPSYIKRLSLFPRCFLFTSTLMLSFLTFSLSLRLQEVKLFSDFIIYKFSVIQIGLTSIQQKQ